MTAASHTICTRPLCSCRSGGKPRIDTVLPMLPSSYGLDTPHSVMVRGGQENVAGRVWIAVEEQFTRCL